MPIVPPQKVCENCGTLFTPKRPDNPNRFCCKHCSIQFLGRSTPKGRVNSGSFKPGMQTWNKGRTGEHSHMYARKMGENARQKLGERSRGEQSNFWKGGVSAEHELQRKTAQYKDWRKAVFERDNYTCQVCGDRSVAGHRVRLHADHIKPFAAYPDLRFDVSNGRTLCVPCHRQTPTFGKHKPEESETGQTAVKVED